VPTDPARVQALFAAAADLADPAARAGYLDRECAGDAPLRARVEALLRAHDQPDSMLDVPVVPAAGGETRTHNPGDAPESAATRTHADGADDELADALAFLAPPGRSDSVGRIGHYEVLEVLGRGGFGIVYRAFDDVLQRVVAVKVLAPSMAVTSPARKRFLREAQSSAKVRHGNAVQIYEIGEQPLPYLVMEFVPGETLQQRLDRTGPLDVPEVLRIGRQIAAGLAAAHGTGLVHRDIKPSNILIGGPDGQVKITDFGLARAADDASLTRSGAVAGTPMYMSPEQARGEKVDARTDLFSLGSVLYAMLTGRPPFRASTTLAVLNRVAEDQPRPIREVIPEVPEWLCRIVDKLHAKDPAGRFASAREVADVLADCERQFQAHHELKDFARIPEPNPRPTRRRQRSPVPLLALVLAIVIGCPVLVGGAAVVGYWLMPIGAPPNPRGGPEPEVVEQVDRPDVAEGGWVPLFNGKDLAGWRRPDGQGEWKVVGNVITGTAGAGDYGMLATGREYANFHLRADVRLTGPGNSGILIRSENGYQAEIDQGTAGSIARSQPFAWLEKKEHMLVEPGAWFRLEVIADGPRLTSKINGQVVADVTDRGPTRGFVALELDGRQNGALVVEFRKVEIKELPPPGPPDANRLKGVWQAVAIERTGQPVPRPRCGRSASSSPATS
jgi:serine/threonine protein kinase